MGSFFCYKNVGWETTEKEVQKKEPEKERETNRKRKIAGRHFGVFNAISNSFIKYGATFDYRVLCKYLIGIIKISWT